MNRLMPSLLFIASAVAGFFFYVKLDWGENQFRKPINNQRSGNVLIQHTQKSTSWSQYSLKIPSYSDGIELTALLENPKLSKTFRTAILRESIDNLLAKGKTVEAKELLFSIDDSDIQIAGWLGLADSAGRLLSIDEIFSVLVEVPADLGQDNLIGMAAASKLNLIGLNNLEDFRSAFIKFGGGMSSSALRVMAKYWLPSQPEVGLNMLEEHFGHTSGFTECRIDYLESWLKRSPQDFFNALPNIGTEDLRGTNWMEDMNMVDFDKWVRALVEPNSSRTDQNLQWLFDHSSDKSQKALALSCLRISTESGMSEAVSYADAMSGENPSLALDLTGELAVQFARKDPALAIPWITKLSQSDQNAAYTAAFRFAREMSSQSPDKAFQFANDPQIANGNAILRDNLQRAAIDHGLRVDPERWMDVVAALDAKEKATILPSVVGTLATMGDPGEAVDLVFAVEDVRERATLTNLLLDGWASRDPEEAFELVQTTSPDQLGEQNNLQLRVLKQWVQVDPYSAAEAILTLPEGSPRNLATAELVKSITESDPEGALVWASGITSNEFRHAVVRRLQDRISPDQMLDIINHHGLSHQDLGIRYIEQ